MQTIQDTEGVNIHSFLTSVLDGDETHNNNNNNNNIK